MFPIFSMLLKIFEIKKQYLRQASRYKANKWKMKRCDRENKKSFLNN